MGEVADVSFSSVDKKTVDGEVPVELCNYTDVFYNRRIRASMKLMTATPVERNTWSLKKGDVLFTKDSETPEEIGIPAYVTEDMPTVLCGYHLGIARPRDGLVDGAYLSETLGSPTLGGQFARIANGVTRFGLTLDATRSLLILLPPLREQQAIATVLDTIDEAIERSEALIAAMERLRDALLNELLTRGVPGWHTEWKDVPGLGMIPADWGEVQLGEVAEVASVQADPREKRFQRDLFVAPDDIESGTGRLISRRTVADAAAISSKYQFSKGDILYSKIRPYLMKVYIPRESGLCSADIYPLRPSAALEPSYLAAVLLTPQFAAYTRTCSDWTGIPKVNRVDLFKYSLSLAPPTEQRAIAAVLDGVDKAIERGAKNGMA